MNILVAPDSFKGSLTAPEVARAMAAGILRAMASADVRQLPMADGGEGTLDAVLSACGGELRECQVTGAEGRPVQAAYGVIKMKGVATVVIEVARVVGLTMLDVDARPVEWRSTRGVGELIRHALDGGFGSFYIGLGGSSTNDGGAGLLQSLGVRLLDDTGAELGYSPAEWHDLARMDFGGLDPRLASCSMALLSDVQNPLSGERGATAVFGPQKGVQPRQVQELDEQLLHLGKIGDAWAGKAVSSLAGAGAAGGLGWALQLLGASYCSGAETVCEITGFDGALRDAAWVITGEGRSDRQTLEGKAPAVVAGKARRAGVPVALLSGALVMEDLFVLGRAFDGCFAASFAPGSLDDAMRHASARLEAAAEQMARLFVGGAHG